MHALDVPALLKVDHRVAVGPEDVAGRDDVGVAEEHDAVAVGVRVRARDT